MKIKNNLNRKNDLKKIKNLTWNQNDRGKLKRAAPNVLSQRDAGQSNALSSVEVLKNSNMDISILKGGIR